MRAIVLFLTLISFNSFAQWDGEFRADGSEYGYSILESLEGNFYVAGSTNSLIDTNSNDGLVIKIDRNGDTVWVKSYGGSRSDYFYEIIETSDSNLLVVGRTSSFIPDQSRYAVWAVKMNYYGDTLWSKSYPYFHDTWKRYYYTSGNRVQETNEGYFIGGMHATGI